MNKLKWVPLHKELNLNVPAMLSDKCIISSSNVNESENYVKMFYIGNNIILCFIWGKIIVLELKQHNSNNSNNNNSEFMLEMVYCSVMKYLTYNNEYVVGIKQISMYDNDENGSTTPNKFAVLTNYNNIYCIDVSLVDYYIELLYKTQIQVIALTKASSSSSVTLCQYYNKDTFIVIHDNALYVYEMSNKNKKLIYNCNTTTTITSNNEVIIHGEITLDYIVVFTSRHVLLLNKRTFALVKVIFTYEQQQTPHTFKGKVFNNKIIYIKANDEFAIYDIHNTDNNQSLKLSSKKILNKFNFHNVIYINDDVICLVNDSRSELYVYLQHVPSMNRESTIYDNRNYIIMESHILIIGVNTKKLIIKAKIAKYREYNAKNNTVTNTNNSSSKLLQHTSKQNENEIIFPSLKDIENDYEHKHKALQKVKHNIKLTNNKINFIINTMTQRNITIKESQYYNYKQHINHLLTILYNLYFSLHNPNYITEYLSLLSPIHHNLTICFITNFGSYSLILNHKHIYLSYFINLTLTKITTLISIAIASNDYPTYLSLLSFHNELNTILK